jgi:hypothetical protein
MNMGTARIYPLYLQQQQHPWQKFELSTEETQDPGLRLDTPNLYPRRPDKAVSFDDWSFEVGENIRLF